MTIPHRAVPAVAAVLSLMLAACAGTPPPIGQLGAAEQAIAGAERAGADRHAPGELHHARVTLAAADDAARKDENATARRLAEEARTAAERAATRARSATATGASQDAGESQPAAPSGAGSGR